MKRNWVYGIVTTMVTFGALAQDLTSARKAIETEKYAEARKTLKNLIASKPDKGENYFYLGQVYLALEKQDSAKVSFQKGLSAKDNGSMNNVGLAHLSFLANEKSAGDSYVASAQAGFKKKPVDENIYLAKAFLNPVSQNPKKAIEFAKAALAIDGKSAFANLVLGDAYVADKNVNSAYSAYQEAFTLDNNMLAAKVQLAVIRRNAGAYPEALADLNKVLGMNANYAPAHREIAETHLAWAFAKGADFKAKTNDALNAYKKYMSLTDSSVDSKMRYADFLILTKDWKNLESEAQQIKKLDPKNTRVLRYLGYAAFENGNVTEAVSALTDFINRSDVTKIKGRDYYYIAKAKLNNSVDASGMLKNATQFDEAVSDLSKAVQLDKKLGDEFSVIGQNLYKQKAYLEAAKVLDIATQNPQSNSYVLDSFYLGNSVLYYAFDAKEKKIDLKTLMPWFDKGLAAYATVNKLSPKTQDAFLNRGKLNRLIDTDSSKLAAVVDYEGYIKAINAKPEELTKDNVKKNLKDSYTFLGSAYSSTDKVKAVENFEKALTYDPNDKYVKESLSVLKK